MVVSVKVCQWQQKSFLLVVIIAELWLNYVHFGSVELWQLSIAQWPFLFLLPKQWLNYAKEVFVYGS